MRDVDVSGLDYRLGRLSPGVETPGYSLSSLQDSISLIGATDNSPAIYCRVAGTMIKAILQLRKKFIFLDLGQSNVRNVAVL